MKIIWLIIQREYLTRVRQKSFIIATLLLPLGMLIFMFLPILIQSLSSDKLRIAVKTDSEFCQHCISDSQGLFFVFQTEPLETIQQTYSSKDFDGVLYLPAFSLEHPSGIRYISDKPMGLSAKDYVTDEIEKEIQKQRLQQNNQSATLCNPIKVSILEENNAGSSLGSSGIAMAIGFMIGLLMYITILIYGGMVMKAVVEEKTSRIVEVMLSSVQPFKLMLGKIMGIGAVGITQLAIWFFLMLVISIVGGLFLQPENINTMSSMSDPKMIEAINLYKHIQINVLELNWTLILCSFIFYYICGYVLYAALFAGLGSAVGTDNDSQALTLPVTLPIIVSFLILTSVIDKPNSNLAFWSSLFPLSSPIIMPARVAYGIPFWQVLISMILTLLGSLAAVWIAAKIYRVGILMYGKKTTFKEISKWLKYS